MALYLGLMSGTSMDGIDAALVEFPGDKLIHGSLQAYSSDTKQRLETILASNTVSLAELCQLNTLIGREFALAANTLLQAANIKPQEIKAIGSHGQTLCHDIKQTIPYTLQLGCAHTISSLTGITVVADFRTRDVINGGQGAPLAPLYHQHVFAQSHAHLVVVNIGGIANCTLIEKAKATRGWDVGPGNCLMDAWVQQHQGHTMDKDGAWARQGQVIDELLHQLLADPFVKQQAPKSIGKEYYSASWLNQLLKPLYKPVDVQATLLAFTVQCIADAIVEYKSQQVVLCGGGAHNSYLLQSLRQALPTCTVTSTEGLGINPDYMEAMMIAWLAYKAIHLEALDLTAITGSSKKEILGAIYPIL